MKTYKYNNINNITINMFNERDLINPILLKAIKQTWTSENDKFQEITINNMKTNKELQDPFTKEDKLKQFYFVEFFKSIIFAGGLFYLFALFTRKSTLINESLWEFKYIFIIYFINMIPYHILSPADNINNSLYGHQIINIFKFVIPLGLFIGIAMIWPFQFLAYGIIMIFLIGTYISLGAIILEGPLLLTIFGYKWLKQGGKV